MFTRTNILARRFSCCSVSVKTVLFRSYCICFYGMELWKCYNLSTVNRLRSCYIKCMKLFFKYSKYYSVTDMLTELRLPSFDTLIYNSRLNIARQVQSSHNSIIAQLCAILRHFLNFCVCIYFLFTCSCVWCVCVFYGHAPVFVCYGPCRLK